MEKRIDAAHKALTPILSQNGFLRLHPSSDEWVRCYGQTLQFVSMSESAGGNLRLQLFAAPKNSTEGIGGTVTRSSVIGGAGSVGGDYRWRVDDEVSLDASIASLERTLKCVVFPILRTLWSEQTVEDLRVRYPETTFDLSSMIAETEVLSLTELAADGEHARVADVQQMLRWAKEHIELEFAALGFESKEGGMAFVRDRGEVSDVVLLQLLNFGVHYGAYAFNWLPSMALDGSGIFSSEFAFMLNGGPVSEDFTLDHCGRAYFFDCSGADFLAVIRSDVLPTLDAVKTRADFQASIKPQMRSSAKLIPGVLD